MMHRADEFRDMGNKSAATMGMDEAPRKLTETLRASFLLSSFRL